LPVILRVAGAAASMGVCRAVCCREPATALWSLGLPAPRRGACEFCGTCTAPVRCGGESMGEAPMPPKASQAYRDSAAV
jgi:hypothetical protein